MQMEPIMPSAGDEEAGQLSMIYALVLEVSHRSLVLLHSMYNLVSRGHVC